MTNPPHEGAAWHGDPGGAHDDPDRNLTQPVQYDRPAPPAAQPHGQPGAARPQPYARPTVDGPPGQWPSPQSGRPPQPPWQPGYGQTAPGQPSYGPPGYGQPPYGQPPYGPPGAAQPPYGQPAYGPQYGLPGQAPAGPPRKSRSGLVGGLAVAALLLVVGAVAAALALRSTVLDPAAVERDVAAQFEQREGVAIDLTCREEMEVEEGESYPCTGVTADGEEVTLQITVTDEDSAAYTWTEP